MAHMLRALLAQLLHQDDMLVDSLYKKFGSVSGSEARSLSQLKDWAADSFKSQQSCFIVLDGMDECGDRSSHEEATLILNWFHDKIIPDCQKEGSSIRLLVSGQRDGNLENLLSIYPAIPLDKTSDHLNDIQRFTRNQASAISQRFQLDEEGEQDLINKVVSTAQGEHQTQIWR
jgi:hypothetical protein